MHECIKNNKIRLGLLFVIVMASFGIIMMCNGLPISPLDTHAPQELTGSIG